MEAIKKKIASLKMEMDVANEKVETCENKARQENFRADQIYDEVRDLEKKLAQMERDYETSKINLEENTAELERCEKAYTKVYRNFPLVFFLVENSSYFYSRFIFLFPLKIYFTKEDINFSKIV